MTAWEVESKLLRKLPPEQRDLVGLLVRHRTIGALLRQALEQNDILPEFSTIHPEKGVVDPDVRVEIALELISPDGSTTLSIERISPGKDASDVVNFMLREWGTIVRISSAPQPDDPRLGPATPPFFTL